MESISCQHFTVRCIDEYFSILISDAKAIQDAKDNYYGLNHKHVAGKIARGDGGFNAPWSWHFIPSTVGLTEYTVEVCDGMPSYVETHIDDFLIYGYCPWTSVIAEIGEVIKCKKVVVESIPEDTEVSVG